MFAYNVFCHKYSAGHVFEEQIEEDLNNNLNKLDNYGYGSPTVKSRKQSRISKKKSKKKILEYTKLKTQIDQWELTELGEEIKQRYIGRIPKKLAKEFLDNEPAVLVDLYRSKQVNEIVGYEVK